MMANDPKLSGGGPAGLPRLPPFLGRELADSVLSLGWYANWNSDTETIVVFPGKIFRYPRRSSRA